MTSRPEVTPKIMRGLTVMEGFADHLREEALTHLSRRELAEWDEAIDWMRRARMEKDRCRVVRDVERMTPDAFGASPGPGHGREENRAVNHNESTGGGDAGQDK